PRRMGNTDPPDFCRALDRQGTDRMVVPGLGRKLEAAVESAAFRVGGFLREDAASRDPMRSRPLPTRTAGFKQTPWNCQEQKSLHSCRLFSRFRISSDLSGFVIGWETRTRT